MINIDIQQNGRIVLRQDTTGIIEGDSDDYEILNNAAAHVKELNGLTIEMGVRLGLSSVIIMNQNTDNKIHICVDPYGAIDYSDDKHGTFKTDYTNEVRNKCLYALHKYAFEYNKNMLFFVLEDTEYFSRFKNGVPVYKDTKQIISEYSLVHFDGPHTLQAVKDEVNFFENKLQIGGVFVFDDLDLYNHDEVEKTLLEKNKFQIFQKGKRKASYIKVK